MNYNNVLNRNILSTISIDVANTTLENKKSIRYLIEIH